MKDVCKTPKLRFPEFNDDWEQRKCGDMTIELSEYDNLQSGYPLLTSSRNGLMFQNEYRDKKSTDNAETLFSVVPYGKCTYRHMSDDNIFHFNINTITEKGLVSREYPVFDANEECNLQFLIQYLNSSPEFTRFCTQRKLGGTRTRLYYKNLCDFSLRAPSRAEQDKIADFFEQLDNLITLHQRKLDQMKEYKKGMLQKMFPKKGGKLPEVRFPGFADDWEQRKCGDILVERNIQHPKSDEYPLVSFTVEKGVTPKTERYEREQLVVGDKDEKKYKETRFNDIVYNPANLKFGAIARNKYGNAVFSPIYVTYEVNGVMAMPSFVEMYVTRKSFIQNALQYQQGTVYERMAVNTDDFAKLEILLPSKEEQCKIGSLFTNLDDLITLHQCKLDLMKEMKAGLLQQMFV